MNEPFLPARISQQTRQLEAELRSRIETSQLETVRQIESMRTYGGDAQLTVAFVGSYDAGKSTIISALTGRTGIPIDANVCTREVTGYRWHGLLLLDTPGVHAGRPAYDALTEKAILDADLLVFVISNELFSDVSGAFFQRLVFQRGKADQTLLVVNKMSQDGGSPEIKRPNLDAVCRPKTSAGFGATFIDARCYLEALDSRNERDRAELLEISHFESFVAKLNEFALTRCDHGRLVSPLQRIRELADRACAAASVHSRQDAATLEFLSRLISCLAESRRRLREALKEPVREMTGQIRAAGNELADEIEPGTSGELLQAREAAFAASAERSSEWLGVRADRVIQDELIALRIELDGIVNGSLGREVRQYLGERLARITFDEGKFSAMSFRPWEAVNEAKVLDNIGRVLNEAGAALRIAVEPAEEGKLREEELNLLECRNTVRATCQQAARTVEQSFWGEFGRFAEVRYGGQAGAFESFRDEILRAQNGRGSEASSFAAISGRASELLAQLTPSSS